jgi:hypothetical protein
LDKLTLLRERAALRQSEVCPHGSRPGECHQCSPRKEPPRPPKPVPRPQDRPGDAQAGVDGSRPTSQAQAVWKAAQAFSRPFTLAELIVAAWHLSPLLSLDGYNLPDAHRVRCCLWGPAGLLKRGRLRRVAGGKLEVAR